MAAEYDRPGSIDLLIKKGAEVDATGPDGRTALYAAVMKDNVSAVSALIRQGADPDRAGPGGLSPRAIAAAHGAVRVTQAIEAALDDRALIQLCACVAADDLDGMRRILAAGAVKDFEKPPAPGEMTPLMLTIRNNNPEAMELLLKAGAKAEMTTHGLETPLTYVMSHYLENPRLAALLLQYGARPDSEAPISGYPLLLAAGGGQETIVRLLLAAGANARVENASGENAAYKAAEGGHGEVISLLKAAGTDLDATDRQGLTPLAVAILKKRRNAFDALLAAGADAKIPDKNGMTTLMDAAWSGEGGMIPDLLKHGLDINARRDGDGFTALHFAAFRGKTDAARYLLAAGADFNAASEDGRIALQVAQERGSEPVAAAIVEKMGDEINNGLRAPQTVRKPLRFVMPGGRNG
jgi:ankyrin repeat protein